MRKYQSLLQNKLNPVPVESDPTSDEDGLPVHSSETSVTRNAAIDKNLNKKKSPISNTADTQASHSSKVKPIVVPSKETAKPTTKKV